MNNDFFNRRVAEIIDQNSLKEKLEAGRALRVKFGVDPTRPDLHLGHTVALRKLKEFQDLGQTVIFLIGDYTARVGDPSGKNKTRPEVTPEEIEANTKTYLDQVGKILDLSKAEIRRNSEWFSQMDFNDVLKLVAKFTVAQILERDDFQKRINSNSDISLHEILYPVMQAYDSVKLEANVEIGGTDQKFNLLAGRALQKKMGQEPQDIMTVPLLVGLDGREKMSKSLDNYVGITESPDQQFGKIMSIPDKLIIEYFNLVTNIPTETIFQYQTELDKGANPRDIKEKLAFEIVKMYHGEENANQARDNFVKRFREKVLPANIEETVSENKNTDLVSLLLKLNITASKSEARRLMQQGAVKIDGNKVTNPEENINISEQGVILEVGKKKIYRVR